MTSTEAEVEVAAATTVADPVVPILDIPPDENLSLETLADKSVGDVAKTDMPTDVAAEEDKSTVVETVTTEVTVTTTEVTEITTSVKEEVIMETPVETALGKREREEDTENGADDDSKRLKADKNGKEQKPPIVAPVRLGPKLFQSSIEMFTYFYDLLHGWSTNVDFNKYEHMVLSDLLSKGHRDADSKIGAGIEAFQIRYHTGWHSRCFYLIRTDGSVEDFSYRKCVDRVMPLPESLFTPSGDIIIEKLFGDGRGKWDRKGKGGDSRGEKDGKGHQGNKGRGGGGGGGWRGGRGGGGRGKRW